MNNIRQIGIALQLYAEDHGGSLPSAFSALAPGYIAADDLSRLKYRPPGSQQESEWLYFPRPLLRDVPDDAILAASPAPERHKGSLQRIVLRGDRTVVWLPDSDFHAPK
jgi:hypothetical protein